MIGDIYPGSTYSDIHGWRMDVGCGHGGPNATCPWCHPAWPEIQREANRRANEAMDAMDRLIDPPGPRIILNETFEQFYSKPGRVLFVTAPPLVVHSQPDAGNDE